MKHILNDLSSMEKQSILEQHKGGKQIDTSRFKTLLESKLGDVKPLVNESTVEFTDLIGKTVIFKPVEIDRVVGDTINDIWYSSELDNENLTNEDQSWWDTLKTEPIKGKIKSVRAFTDNFIDMNLEDLDGVTYTMKIDVSAGFECGSDKFKLSIDITSSSSWFGGKMVQGTFTNIKLAENLNNRLPCGNFDFAKVDADETPDNFA